MFHKQNGRSTLHMRHQTKWAYGCICNSQMARIFLHCSVWVLRLHWQRVRRHHWQKDFLCPVCALFCRLLVRCNLHMSYEMFVIAGPLLSFPKVYSPSSYAAALESYSWLEKKKKIKIKKVLKRIAAITGKKNEKEETGLTVISRYEITW